MTHKKSLIPKGGDDRVYTPESLAKKIVSYYNPYGKKCLDPCRGKGAFYNAFQGLGINSDWCEIDEGKDFFQYDEKVDWIITNFPWSLHRKCINHSMKISDNIVSLVTLNHLLALKARLKDVRNAGFFIREIITMPTPKEFPASGFQLGTILLNKSKGDCKFIHWENYD
jgi:hypothetical protein